MSVSLNFLRHDTFVLIYFFRRRSCVWCGGPFLWGVVWATGLVERKQIPVVVNQVSGDNLADKMLNQLGPGCEVRRIWSVNGGCNGEKTMVCLRKLSCHFAAISENCTSPLLQCHLNIILTNQCCSTGSFREGEVGRYWEGQVKEVSIYVCAPLVSSCSQPQL